MRECKILHIHDGGSETLENGNYHLLERYPWAEETINELLAQGYEVKHMIPQFTPAQQGEGNYTFYRSGFVVYLEREV